MRKTNELTAYTVRLHKVGKYRYASVQKRKPGNDDEPNRYAHVHLGKVDVNNVFEPYGWFLLLPQEERDRYVFPSDWDLRSLNTADEHPGLNPGVQVKMYGGVWLLEGLAEQLYLREDLMDAFSQNQDVVDMIMTVAMFMVLTDYREDRLPEWQMMERYPYRDKLTMLDIDQFEQYITRFRWEDFLGYRLYHYGNEPVLAVIPDRLNRKFHARAWERGAEIIPVPMEYEITVYSLSRHIPVGSLLISEESGRSVGNIMSELNHAGFRDAILVMESLSTELLKQCISENVRCIGHMQTDNALVFKQIRSFGPVSFAPEGFSITESLNLYTGQFAVSYPVSPDGGMQPETNRLMMNLYLEPVTRTALWKWYDVYQQTDNVVLEEVNRSASALSRSEKAAFQAAYEDFICTWKEMQITEDKRSEVKGGSRGWGREHLQRTEYVLADYTLDEVGIAERKTTAGFNALITCGLELSAEEAMQHYLLIADRREDEELRDVQLVGRKGYDPDKTYFGRKLIHFVADTIRCHLRHQWSENPAFRKCFRSPRQVMDTMRQILCAENAETGELLVYAFDERQKEICRFLGLTPPAAAAISG